MICLSTIFIMISREDRKGIYDLTVELLPSVLEEIGFDAEEVAKIEDTEEIGHRFYNKFEVALSKRLIERDSRFSMPIKKAKSKSKGTRKMQDILFISDYVNIKFGYDKNGQPNMCAFNKLIKKFSSNEIDSYWILSVDAKYNKVSFFNLYEHLDYTHTDLGPGQTMLQERRFFNYFDQDKDYAISRNDVILQMKEINRIATKSLVERRERQGTEREDILNAAL